MKLLRLASIVMLSVCALAHGQPSAKPVASSDAQKFFDVLKTLAGSWKGAITTDNPAMSTDQPMPLSIRVASSGNALIHELSTPGPEVTVFYLDSDHLTLIHYCDYGNRPHMVARPSADGKTVVELSQKAVGGGVAEQDQVAAGDVGVGYLAVGADRNGDFGTAPNVAAVQTAVGALEGFEVQFGQFPIFGVGGRDHIQGRGQEGVDPGALQAVPLAEARGRGQGLHPLAIAQGEVEAAAGAGGGFQRLAVDGGGERRGFVNREVSDAVGGNREVGAFQARLDAALAEVDLQTFHLKPERAVKAQGRSLENHLRWIRITA